MAALPNIVSPAITGLFKLPDSVSYESGAFTEPLACAVYGLKKLEIEPGQFVAVLARAPWA